LDEEEQSIMSKHPLRSAQIIGELKGLSRAREYVLHHHEFIDGSGYPDHLKGDAIPLGSRIILVADAYDAMTTDRPYRKAIGHHLAIAELRKNSGWQFDGEVVEALVQMVGEHAESLSREIHESVLGLSIEAIDPTQTGTQYRAEAERRDHLSAAS
jgi:HD-GYP domain-containing protein (c-di-GMP phosphodiesterase class II)